MSVRTTLTIQKLNEDAGVAVDFDAVDPTNGMQVNNTGKCIVVVKTGGTASVTVQIPSREDLNGRTGDVSQAVGSDVTRIFGPFGDSSIWGDGTNLFLDFDAVVGDVEIAVVQY